MHTSLMDFMCPSVPAFSQGQIILEKADRVRTKKKAREFVTFPSLGNGLVFQINYSLLFIVVETLFAPKCCFKNGLMTVKWNNSFLTPNKSFFF